MLLNVNSVNLMPKINVCKSERKAQIQSLKSDVFVKSSNNVSFKGNNSFIDWAENTDFVHTQLPEILSNPENKIGSGFSHTAYNIPNNDDYILRAHNSALNNIYDYTSAKIKETENKELSINIGQKTAEIQIKDENNMPYMIEILRKQKGDPLGIPPTQAVFIPDSDELRQGELPYEDMERKKYYASSIHKVAQMPLESYEKLIDNLQAVAKSGYSFDHLNSNNFLIDGDNNNINMIDMDKVNKKVDYGNALYALTNINYFSTFASKYDKNPISNEELEQAINDTVEIIEKFINAMQNKNVKFKNRHEYSYEFMKLFTSFPFAFYCKAIDENQKWEKLEQIGVVED